MRQVQVDVDNTSRTGRSTKTWSTVHSTPRTGWSTSAAKSAEPKAAERGVWSDGYKNCGVLCTARTGRDGQRLQQEVQNRRLWQEAVVWGGGYKNCRLLCTARTGRDGQHLQEKVQNRRLRKDAVVWSCKYKNFRVLCSARTGRDVSARTGRDGQHLQEKVQNRRLRKDAVVWSCRYKNFRVLCSTRTVLSTHWTGWSTSAGKSAEPKAAERCRRMELQVQKL